MGQNNRYWPANIGGTVVPGPSKVIPMTNPAPKDVPGTTFKGMDSPGRGGFDQLRTISLAHAATGTPTADSTPI